MERRWLVPKQVAYELQCSYKTVLILIHKKQLPAYKIGRHLKIKPEDLTNYINSKQTTSC